jgi:hypothetical protein
MSAQARCDFDITGTLLAHAEARHQAIDGAMVPVLCFVAQSDSAIGTVCRVHQLFPQGHEKQCEARARELRKGAKVRLQAGSVGIELLVHNASHVELLQAAAPAPAREAVPA